MSAVSVDCGFLAVWTEVDPSATTEYLEWLTREHLHERVDLPGFRSARVHRCAEGRSRFFVCYETDSAQALACAEYLARLNQPSDWSRRMNPLLLGTVRGVGRARRMGCGFGAEIVTLRDSSDSLLGALSGSWLDSLATTHGMSGLLALENDPTITGIGTVERQLRKGADGHFCQALVMEASSASVIDASLAWLESRLGSVSGGTLELGRYRLIHGLERRWL